MTSTVKDDQTFQSVDLRVSAPSPLGCFYIRVWTVVYAPGRMPPGKDPNKPKGQKSAYAFFVQEQSSKRGASSYTEFSNACAAKWHAMDDSEKAKFSKLQEEDKIRYRNEMEKYNPPGEKKRRRRKKKDKNLPKRTMSAFMFFSMEKRPKLKEEKPYASALDLAKMLGAAWRIMKNDQRHPTKG